MSRKTVNSRGSSRRPPARPAGASGARRTADGATGGPRQYVNVLTDQSFAPASLNHHWVDVGLRGPPHRGLHRWMAGDESGGRRHRDADLTPGGHRRGRPEEGTSCTCPPAAGHGLLAPPGRPRRGPHAPGGGLRTRVDRSHSASSPAGSYASTGRGGGDRRRAVAWTGPAKARPLQDDPEQEEVLCHRPAGRAVFGLDPRTGVSLPGPPLPHCQMGVEVSAPPARPGCSPRTLSARGL